MALVTTLYTFGWYGIQSDAACEDFDLRTAIGTYDYNGGNPTYSGPFADKIDQANKIEIYGYKDGGSFSWTLGGEAKFDRSGNHSGNKEYTTLKCGRMYMIKNFSDIELDIPGFVPSASGVDMGRVVPA